MLFHLVASRHLGCLSKMRGLPLTLFIRSLHMGWVGATGRWGGERAEGAHVLLVQPRHRKDLPEASSLIEALGGGPPTAVATVGHSR